MLKTNKSLIVLVALLSVFLLSSVSFAANDTTTGGATMTIGESGGKGTLELNFSPNVSAYYGDDGTTDVQWYVISTYHSGGNKTYATAQNITSVYYKEGTPSFANLILTEASMDDWSASIWKR